VGADQYLLEELREACEAALSTVALDDESALSLRNAVGERNGTFRFSGELCGIFL
jgi:hypothetical protein